MGEWVGEWQGGQQVGQGWGMVGHVGHRHNWNGNRGGRKGVTGNVVMGSGQVLQGSTGGRIITRHTTEYNGTGECQWGKGGGRAQWGLGTVLSQGWVQWGGVWGRAQSLAWKNQEEGLTNNKREGAVLQAAGHRHGQPQPLWARSRCK